MKDIYLRANDEEVIAKALPQLRDEESWIWASPQHALDVHSVLVVPALNTLKKKDDVEKVVPVQLREGFFMTLRIAREHPDYAAIVAACEPFVVEPETPQRVFA